MSDIPTPFRVFVFVLAVLTILVSIGSVFTTSRIVTVVNLVLAFFTLGMLISIKVLT